jgi:hypothetical protein
VALVLSGDLGKETAMIVLAVPFVVLAICLMCLIAKWTYQPVDHHPDDWREEGDQFV